MDGKYNGHSGHENAQIAVTLRFLSWFLTFFLIKGKIPSNQWMDVCISHYLWIPSGLKIFLLMCRGERERVLEGILFSAKWMFKLRNRTLDIWLFALTATRFTYLLGPRMLVDVYYWYCCYPISVKRWHLRGWKRIREAPGENSKSNLVDLKLSRIEGHKMLSL